MEYIYSMAQAWKEFERTVARKFRRWWPDARRGMQFQEGEWVPDVVAKDCPYYIECKTTNDGSVEARDGKDRYSFAINDPVSRFELWCLYYGRMAKWRDENGAKEAEPIIVVRSRGKWFVVILAVVWEELGGEVVQRETALVPWSAFSAALDKIHGGKDE